MQRPFLYAITDERLISRGDFCERIESALRGGVEILQLRDKTSPDADVLALGRELRDLCAGYRVPLVINDRLSVARELGIGVHLGDQDATVSEARAALGQLALIGRSCHGDMALALAAEAEGASYVAFGGIYPTLTKPDNPVVGLSILEEARGRLLVPFAAIGGIDETNIAGVAATRPWAICVVRAVFGQPDPGEAAARLISLMEGASASP